MENSIEKKFHDEIIKLCDDNKSSNNSIFTRERYRETIGNVKEAKLSSKKTALQRYFLRQYDVLSVAGIENSFAKVNDNVRTKIETETDLDTNTETETDLDTNTEKETDLDTNTETETDLEINTNWKSILTQTLKLKPIWTQTLKPKSGQKTLKLMF